MWDELLKSILAYLFEIAVTTAVAVIMIFVTRLLRYAMEKLKANDAEEKAVQYLLDGMAKAQEEIVRDAKQRASDGKLTKEEALAARNLAYQKAVELATGPAKDLMLTWSQERIDSLIKQSLAKFKKGG